MSTVPFIGSTVWAFPPFLYLSRKFGFSIFEILLYITLLKSLFNSYSYAPVVRSYGVFLLKLSVRRGSTPRRFWRAGLCEGSPSPWHSFPSCIFTPCIYPLCRHDPRALHFALGNAKNNKKKAQLVERRTVEWRRVSLGGWFKSGSKENVFLVVHLFITLFFEIV